MRYRAVLLVLMLLPSAAAWNQPGGGPERDWVIDRPSGPVDVLAADHVLASDERFGGRYSMLVSSGDGALGIIHDTDGCSLADFDQLPSLAFSRHPIQGLPCVHMRPQAYDEATGLLWVCDYGRGADILLAAIDVADGSIVHALRPTDVALTAAVDGLWWRCSGALLDADARELIVPFAATATNIEGYENVIVAVHLDTGEVLRSNPGSLTGEEVPGDILPDFVTKAADRYAVHATGLFPPTGTDPSLRETAMIVLRQDLTTAGALYPVFPNTITDPASTSEENWMSWTFAAQGALVATVFGTDVALIDTSVQTQVVQRSDAGHAETIGPTEAVDTPPAAWGPHGAYFPFRRTVVAMSTPEFELQWVWPGEGAAWRPEQVSPTLGGELLIQSHRSITNYDTAIPEDRLGLPASDAAVLLRLEADDGRVLQRVPINLRSQWFTPDPFRVEAFHEPLVQPLTQRTGQPDTFGAIYPTPAIIQVGPWLVGADTWGNVTLLGEGETLQGIDVPDAFPARGEEVALRFTAPQDVLGVLVAWGDGDSGEIPRARDGTFEAQHVFTNPGEHIIAVTALYADGTTRTGTAAIDVDGEDLTFMQQQFAPENQDRTWGVIGLLLVLFGALLSLVARRVGRGRIARGLRELSIIRQDAVIKPLDALRRLQLWHETQEARLIGGRLTEDQFRVLESRASRVLRRTARTALGTGLSSAFMDRFEAAILDGFVDPQEVEQLRIALDGERATAAQKRRARDLLDAWA